MRGISSVIAVVLLLLITVLLASFAWLFFPSVFDPYTGCIRLVDFTEGKLAVQNCGSKEIPHFNITINGIEIKTFEPNTYLNPGETRDFTLHYLSNNSLQTIRLIAPGIIETVQWDVSRGWVIDAEKQVVEEGGVFKLQFNGHAYLNDGSGDPYANRKIEYTVVNIADQSTVFSAETVTDANGLFTVGPEDWDTTSGKGFSNLYPTQFWQIQHDLTTPLANWVLQPPDSVQYQQDVTGDGVPDQLLQSTQEPYLLLSNRSVLYGGKEITPLAIKNDQLSFRFDHSIDLVQAADPRQGDDLWFGTTYFSEYGGPGQSVNEIAIACTADGATPSGTLDAPCFSGIAEARLTSTAAEAPPGQSVDGGRFMADLADPSAKLTFAIFSQNNPSISPPLPLIHGISGSLYLAGKYQGDNDGMIEPDDINYYSAPYYEIGGFLLNEYKLVEQGTKRKWTVSIPVADMIKSLEEKYEITDPTILENAYYYLEVHATPRNSPSNTYLGVSVFNFAVNLDPAADVPPIPILPGMDCTNPSIPLGYCNSPVQVLYWKLADQLQQAQVATFSAQVTVNRPPTGTASLAGMHDAVYRVAPSGSPKEGDVIEAWDAGSGMIYPSTSLGTLTELDIPSQTVGLSSYAIGKPTGFSGGNVDATVTITVMNVNQYLSAQDLADKAYNDILVFKRRGDRKECADASLLAGESVSCTITQTTLPGETLSNYANLHAKGIDLAFTSDVAGQSLSCSYTVSGTAPNCGQPDPNIPECGFANSVCHSITFDKLGTETFAFVDNPAAPGSGIDPFSASITIDPPTDGEASAAVKLWNWYLTQENVWNNSLTHILTLETKQPGNFYPAYVEKPFLV